MADDEKGKMVRTGKAQVKHEQSDHSDDDDCYEIDPIDFTRKLDFHLSDDDDGIALIADKGPVALRDFPHPRHLCGNYPFDTTSHESYCSMCFCYVCEVAAPCPQWRGRRSGHCNISRKTFP